MSSMSHELKLMLCRNPKLPATECVTELQNRGYKATLSTIATIRSDFLNSWKVLAEANMAVEIGSPAINDRPAPPPASPIQNGDANPALTAMVSEPESESSKDRRNRLRREARAAAKKAAAEGGDTPADQCETTTTH
jgi:hypothetical protein